MAWTKPDLGVLKLHNGVASMPIRSRAETGNKRRAAKATLPRIISDPRSRVHAGGLGMLWLTALTFSLPKEVRAADPNATVLDDGSITYKDFEHGVFELVTKEAIPRRFLVEDPGQTIVLRPEGSTISVNQVANSAARMAELQAAEQEARATLERGLNSTGSSTPPLVESLPVQPINFIPADNSLPDLDPLAAPSVLFVSIPEIIVGRIPPPPPQPPTLNAIAGPTEIDTVAFDVFTATTGAFVASSPNGDAALTFGISGGTAGTTVVEGVTYDVSQVGPYGTLYVASSTGAYIFVPDNDAINALTEPATTLFIITVSDGSLSASQAFTIAINGTNDAALISGTITGATIEAGDVDNSSPGTPTATGTLTAADVDHPPNTFTAVSSPTASAGGFGTFMMTAAGVWTYTINQDNSAIQALNVGGTLTDTFTVTSIDGTAQVVTVTIRGANDAAVISGAKTGAVTEDGGEKYAGPTATGTLTAADVDNAPDTFTAVSCPTASDAGYGTFTMTADGLWTYKLDDDNCAVQALDFGDTLTDTFTVTSIDGTPQVVTITIHGASDADPNDFDHLAAGKFIVSDPPYIFGTPRNDVVEKCGHHGRIIYTGAGDDTIDATGKCDLIYAGSGNDRVKGNDGDDTIYGGSGRDVISGGHGCDVIVGGYGADKLAGGEGNDRFVFLSAADSNAARFDVVSDFRSGYDRIDLAALGALAFLALTSSSTSVPAHTIAWFYDSTANKTIVYVNSTDHTLSIGDSALVEIHLEGFVALQAADFAPEPTATQAAGEAVHPEFAATVEIDATVKADASFDWTDGDGAHLAGGNWTTRMAGTGGDSDLSGNGEVRTPAGECGSDDADIISVGRQSAELTRVHVRASTESNLTPDQTPARGCASRGADFDAPHDGRFASGRIEHGQTPDEDSLTARSHTDWTFGFATRSHTRWHNEDHRSEDHRSNAGGWNDHIAHMLDDSFHFRGRFSSSEASDFADAHRIPRSSDRDEDRSGSGGPREGPEATSESFASRHSSSDTFDFDHAGNDRASHGWHDLLV